MDEIEHFFDCPYCGESVSMLIDSSVQEQEYIEDCEVCCRPIEVHYRVKDGSFESFNASRTDF